MNQKLDSMLRELEPTMEQKCAELRAARREKLLSRLFVLLCAAVVLIPTLLVLFGVSLTALIAPLVFLSLSVVLLLPVLLSGRAADQGGNEYEQA